MSTVALQATRQRAARDILLQIVTRVLNLALGVVVTALLARTLGTVGYGQWSTILVVFALIGYIANFGMQGVAVREAARDPDHEHEWIGAVIMLRLLALGPVILLSLLAILIMQQSHQMLVAGLILIVTMPFSGAGALQLVFQLRVNNLVPMLVLTLKSVLWAIAVALVFVNDAGMIALAIGLSLTNAIGSVVQGVAAWRISPRRPRPSRAKLRPLLRTGVPLGIAGMLIISYARIDQVMVFALVGSRSAGLYGSVYNILEQSSFVPISILTTLAPVMAASWPGNRERLLRTAQLTAELLAIASLGGLAFATAAATPFVRLVFGPQFLAAAPALPVLAAAFVFICFGYLNSNVLIVLQQQRRLLIISVLALVVNVLGNLVLIPLTGFMGAAWMTLATEVVVFVASLRLILRTLELRRLEVGRIGRTVLAAALLAGGLALLRLAGAPLSVLVLASCVCYPALLFGLRALTAADVRIVLRREKLV
jgi:O-antigen/teichoic acid export membrane protein